DPGRLDPGAERDGQLTVRADVEVEALFGDPARAPRTEEGLGGVEDVVRRERIAEGAGPGPEVRFVEDVRRGVDVGDQVGERNPADDQAAVDLASRRRP